MPRKNSIKFLPRPSKLTLGLNGPSFYPFRPLLTPFWPLFDPKWLLDRLRLLKMTSKCHNHSQNDLFPSSWSFYLLLLYTHLAITLDLFRSLVLTAPRDLTLKNSYFSTISSPGPPRSFRPLKMTQKPSKWPKMTILPLQHHFTFSSDMTI